MAGYSLNVKELPLAQLQPHPDFKLWSFGEAWEDHELDDSIRDLGILQPLMVSREAADRYLIVDGHRRYFCARFARMETVPCRILPKLSGLRYNLVRWSLNRTVKPWMKAEEEARRRARIKQRFGEDAPGVHRTEPSNSESVIAGAVTE